MIAPVTPESPLQMFFIYLTTFPVPPAGTRAAQVSTDNVKPNLILRGVKMNLAVAFSVTPLVAGVENRSLCIAIY